jgi:hypothetical protein
MMLDVIYRKARTRISDLAATFSDEQLRAPVPATPKWTMHELLAHLVGCSADAASGRVDGAPGEQWTARHVEERRASTTPPSRHDVSRCTGRHGTYVHREP